MTNLDIIKYLAYENPKRLAELLDDIYCIAWNCGSYASSNGEGKLLEECEIDDFDAFLSQDASQAGLYYDDELEKWNKDIHPTITIDFGGGKLECKDGKLSMQRDDYDPTITIDQIIDEIKLLENITESDKYSAEVYDVFRKEVCANCSDPNCMRSQVEIYDCDKF